MKDMMYEMPKVLTIHNDYVGTRSYYDEVPTSHTQKCLYDKKLSVKGSSPAYQNRTRFSTGNKGLMSRFKKPVTTQVWNHLTLSLYLLHTSYLSLSFQIFIQTKCTQRLRIASSYSPYIPQLHNLQSNLFSPIPQSSKLAL